MKDNSNYSQNSKFIDNIVKDRRGKIDLKYYSSGFNSTNKIRSSSIELNKINIKELSKLCDRPIIKNSGMNYPRNIYSFDKKNIISGNNYLENDRINPSRAGFETNINNIYNYNNYFNNKKSTVYFTDPPKKLSDYILKNKSSSKKKVYKLVFVEDNNLNSYNNETKDKNSNDEYYYERSKDIKINNFNRQEKYNGIFLNNLINYDINQRKNKYNNNISTINPEQKKIKNENKSNIDKTQEKKIFTKGNNENISKKYRINNHRISASKINKILSKITKRFMKIYFKIFLVKIKYISNNLSTKKIMINKKINKKDRIYVNKYSNITNQKFSYNNYIYKRKNKSPGNFSSFSKSKGDSQNSINIRIIPKKDKSSYDTFSSINYKNKSKNEIMNIIKYIFKKCIFLHFPTFFYRLKILQKMNILEKKYNCLYNLIKIKQKIFLYHYFNKFRNNILSVIVKNEWENKRRNAKRYSNFYKNYNKNINIKNNDINHSNNDFMKTNFKKRFLDKNRNILNNSNELTQKIKLILAKIINNQESKYNKYLLEKSFKKWKKCSLKQIINIPSLRSKFERSNIINRNKSTSSPNKKQIKVKKMKNIYNSRYLSLSGNKMTLNSVDSDNINFKKMKVHKVNVLLSQQIKTQDIQNINPIIKINSTDNSFFITKIANIMNKINYKNDLYKCFKLWKKETKK